MIASLPLFHQIGGRKILLLGIGDAAEPKRRLIERAGGVIIADIPSAIEAGVRIAFVAYDDARSCEDAANELRHAGMLVNVVDRPDLCDFTTPSILDRNPLLIAIGTGGASAGLAKHIRLRLERILPQNLGKLANALAAIRPDLRQRYPKGADRRRILDEAMRENGTLDPMKQGANKRVKAWLEGEKSTKIGTMETVVITSDDPEELTLRTARLLGTADRLLIDGNIAPEVLARSRADAERIMFSEAVAAEAYLGQTLILLSQNPA